jgi:hypothetical protein
MENESEKMREEEMAKKNLELKALVMNIIFIF